MNSTDLLIILRHQFLKTPIVISNNHQVFNQQVSDVLSQYYSYKYTNYSPTATVLS